MVASKIVIKGRVERGEFREPFRQCVEMLEQLGMSYSVNPTTTDEPIYVALFFQSYPHEFLAADLARLRRENPFAPFFFVLGVCCEGMLRTAGPLDSPFYCYVHGWSDADTEQIRRFLTDQPSLFSLPLTTENDEIAQFFFAPSANSPRPLRLNFTAESAKVAQRAQGEHGEIASSMKKSLILTHYGPFGNDSAMNRLIADEQVLLGYEPVFSGKTLPDAFEGKIFADADDSPPEKILESIQRLRRRFADNDFTVYVDSPRIDEKNGYMRFGVARVMPKMR